jgi:type IV pilus assembly protein PilQ
MGFSKAAPEPVSFSVSNPARIALDFPDTKNNLKKRSQAIKVSSVQSINTAQAKDRTRAVINLSDMMVYQTEVKDKQLLVTLAPSSTPPAFLVQKTEAVEASPASPNADYEVAASNYSNTEATDADIKAIDFRRGTDGAGRILIKLANPNTPIDIRQQGTQLIVELSNAQLPTHLQRRMDVLDFATPVQMIDAKTIGNKSQIMIKTKGKFSQLAYQAGDTYTVEVRPVSKKKKKLLSKKQISFKGERLSLNFQDIEVRSVLQLIADFTGLNIVVSDDVSGNVTLRLKNVP